MTRAIAFIMDPIEHIKPRKDSTFAMMLAAQRRGHRILYATAADIWLDAGVSRGRFRPVSVIDRDTDYFHFEGELERLDLGDIDIVMMRKDPPFDIQYVNDTYVLQRAQEQGAMVVNDPDALRDINEKSSTNWFPDLAPASRFSRDPALLKEFVHEHGRAVVKPVDGMGGTSIFQVAANDPNLNVIFETVTDNGQRQVVVQQYLDAIETTGDKRILVVDGQTIPFALARHPAADDFRGNLAKGGHGVSVELSDRDREIAAAVGPWLLEQGVLFAGLDVIGDRLTEINVTSPTCIRELDRFNNLDIAGMLLDRIEAKLS